MRIRSPFDCYVTWRAWMSLLWMWQGLIWLKGAAMPVLTRINVRWSVVTTGGSITGCEASWIQYFGVQIDMSKEKLNDIFHLCEWRIFNKPSTPHYIFTGWPHTFEIFPPWILAVRCPKVIHRSTCTVRSSSNIFVWFVRDATEKGVAGLTESLISSLFAIAKGLVKYEFEFLDVIGIGRKVLRVFLLFIHYLY